MSEFVDATDEEWSCYARKVLATTSNQHARNRHNLAGQATTCHGQLSQGEDGDDAPESIRNLGTAGAMANVQ